MNRNRLKIIRKAKRKTQQEVASFIGISQNAYSYWENGKVKIDNESISRLAEYFSVSADFLLGRAYKMTCPPEQWHSSLREDYKNADIYEREFLEYKYGKIIYVDEKEPSAPEGTEGMGENEKRLFAMWSQVPEEQKPELLNLIEAALRMRGEH